MVAEHGPAMALVLLAAACGSGRGITPIRTPFNRGVYLQAQGDLDAAIAEYRSALQEDAADLPARFNLATALEDSAAALRGSDATGAAARLLEAEREYSEVLRRSPDHVRALVNLAAIERDRGDLEAASERLQRAVVAWPDLALPHTALASAQLATGDVHAAEATLRRALAAEPLDVSANLMLGRLLADANRLEEARKCLRDVLRRAPDDAETLLTLADVESRSGRSASALALVEQVLLADPHRAEAHLRAADLQQARGDLEAAVWHLWRARDLDRSGSRRDYAAELRSLYGRLLAR